MRRSVADPRSLAIARRPRSRLAPSVASRGRRRPSTAKVVIIVGATHGATAGYRADADAAYAEAIKYTSNVVKVYSPNATWAKVKAAAKGANDRHLLRPRQRLAEPVHVRPEVHDQGRLRASTPTAGKLATTTTSTTASRTWPTLDLAPNAVVLLHHLCYASGNSEPGDAAPSGHGRPPARRQLRAPASSRAAPGPSSPTATAAPSRTSAALFTTARRRSSDLWRSAPNFHGHVSAFASTRTPGATAYSDTDTPTRGFYRSLVAQARPDDRRRHRRSRRHRHRPGQPRRARQRRRSAPPARGLYDDATLTPDAGSGRRRDRCPAGTRLRTSSSGTATAATGADRRSRSRASTTRRSTAGSSPPTSLPRDSRAPRSGRSTRRRPVLAQRRRRFDTAHLTGRFSETVDWRVRIHGAGTPCSTDDRHGRRRST